MRLNDKVNLWKDHPIIKNEAKTRDKYYHANEMTYTLHAANRNVVFSLSNTMIFAGHIQPRPSAGAGLQHMYLHPQHRVLPARGGASDNPKHWTDTDILVADMI